MILLNHGIDFEKSKQLMKTIPHTTAQGQVESKWRNSNNREIKAQSFCWFVCWAYTGMSSPAAKERAREIFNSIFSEIFGDFSHFLKKYPLDGAFHTRARSIRNNEPQDDDKSEVELGKILDRVEILTEEGSIMQNLIDLLESNFNLILTGAPGTGKTYLAKQIAIKMIFPPKNKSELSEKKLSLEENLIFSEHYSFVQFHPSYDYTDFVEGLRAEEADSGVTFRLYNGIFKEFCRRAIAKNTGPANNFDEMYDKFINEFLETPVHFETLVQKKKFRVEINSKKSCVAIPETESATPMSVTKEMIRNYVLTGAIKDWKPYTTAIGEYFKEKYPIHTTMETHQENNLPYIFVIDEINRGEISKIFGELFFSIDSGYRGTEGKVMTQYANIQDDETIFDPELGKGWFYVPKNVYIIGTMNDIDRSVESFDFAMRRRFVWQEIRADDTAVDMGLSQESINRMKNLNKAIERIEGLNSSYHVGGAYFKKLINYGGDYTKLWDNHIYPLIKEYLRGLPDEESNIKLLERAYKNGTSVSSNIADTKLEDDDL
ncbi:AAA family ATPase [Treponema sp. TIM-1]|uniref:McrB family protein n=1 Tax=Treponema sp. TIM-1 TaxID=2898417 RepID=UPI0039805651